VDSDFAFAVAKKLKEVKDNPALFPEELWRLVYDRSRDVPASGPPAPQPHIRARLIAKRPSEALRHTRLRS
jgi:hypothetical protein